MVNKFHLFINLNEWLLGLGLALPALPCLPYPPALPLRLGAP